MCAVFCHSEPKLATLKFLRRQNNLPPTAANQKHPGFGRFSPSPFERRFFFFLSRSVEQKTRNMIAKSENDRSSDVLVLVVVEAVDVSIGLIGAFCFAVCRFVLFMFGALFRGCFDVSWLSLSLSACFVSQCSFSFVNSECSLLLNFDMLDVISVSSVFTTGFRS
jgi:hypothetical protein